MMTDTLIKRTTSCKQLIGTAFMVNTDIRTLHSAIRYKVRQLPVLPPLSLSKHLSA